VTRLEKEARIGKSGALASQLSRLNLVVLDELGYLPFARSGGQPSGRLEEPGNFGVTGQRRG